METALFEPQAHRVPGAPEEARRRHVSERQQRISTYRLAVERDLDRPHRLTLDYRRQQRLDRFQRKLEILSLPLRQGHIPVDDEPGGHRLLGALPDAQRADRLSALVELHRIEELESVVQQLLRF